jgi:hypothetical protein
VDWDLISITCVRHNNKLARKSSRQVGDKRFCNNILSNILKFSDYSNTNYDNTYVKSRWVKSVGQTQININLRYFYKLLKLIDPYKRKAIVVVCGLRLERYVQIVHSRILKIVCLVDYYFELSIKTTSLLCSNSQFVFSS